jgi:curved DNA-binding protein CbpA
MEVDFKKKIEVEALAKILDGLDHYGVLRLKPGAPIPECERAYARQSKLFHPDRFFGVRDPKFMKKVTAIFKRVNEAGQVLKNPELKRLYDEKMGYRTLRRGKGTGGDGRSGPVGGISKAALEAERASQDGDDVVGDKRARKYWDLAQIAEMNEDWNGVVMNLQFAMTYEKDNPVLIQRLADAKVKMGDKMKANANPYKIKIV